MADAWQLCSAGTQCDAQPRGISRCGAMEKSAACRQICTQSGSTMETAGEQRRHREGRSGDPCQDLRGMSEILLCAWCVHLAAAGAPTAQRWTGAAQGLQRALGFASSLLIKKIRNRDEQILQSTVFSISKVMM